MQSESVGLLTEHKVCLSRNWRAEVFGRQRQMGRQSGSGCRYYSSSRFCLLSRIGSTLRVRGVVEVGGEEYAIREELLAAPRLSTREGWQEFKVG